MPAEILKTKKLLEEELEKIEAQLGELNQRLPAHSVKPDMMAELMNLEEKRDAVLAKIEYLRQQAAGNRPAVAVRNTGGRSPE